MQYISGLQALNIPCSLDTCGDWHLPLQRIEEHPNLWESAQSPFGKKGIEKSRYGLPYPVANHIRACLDMLQAGDFSNLQGMRRDYLCTDQYDDEIFQDVWNMRTLPGWKDIDRFMEKEYLMKWVRYKRRCEENGSLAGST